MSYAQINYSQKLGTGPKAISIAAGGCFVTSFSNLLERFGVAKDPAALNQFFIDHGTYITEADGTKDLLAFSSITAFAGNVRITSQGSGSPTDDNSIVKFVYDGGKTHFCLVASAGMGTIIDSWDGKIKSWNAYGGPVAYATYTNAAAQPTTTAKAQARYAVVETYPNGKQVRLNKQPTQLWGMNYAFAYMVDHPVETHNEGEIWVVTNRVHHEDGMDYYRREGQVDGFNVADCDDFTPPAPAPAPYKAPAGPVTAPSNKHYLLVTTVPGYRTATQAGNHDSPASNLSPGDYFVFNTYHNRPDLINITRIDGQPGAWINTADNVVASPPAPEPPTPPVPAPVAVLEPENVPAEVPAAPANWKDAYKPFTKAIHYIATRDLTVIDLDNPEGPKLPLPKYNAGSGTKLGMVAAYGTVPKDGIEYYRLKAETDTNFDNWYCVPKLDANTRTPNLLVAPGETTTPVSKVTVAKDAVVLAKSHLEFDVPKFLDDIIPKFLKKTKITK